MAHHVPIHELKSLMGFSSVRTTERHYLAVSDNLAVKVRSPFGEVVARAS